MPLPKHSRNANGAFRRELNDSLAGNLRKDYPEFEEFRSEAKLGNIKKQLGLAGDASVNSVRKAIRGNRSG